MVRINGSVSVGTPSDPEHTIRMGGGVVRRLDGEPPTACEAMQRLDAPVLNIISESPEEFGFITRRALRQSRAEPVVEIVTTNPR